MTKVICNDNDILHIAIDECDNISDKELDLVLLPPDNVDGDTNNEEGNDRKLRDITLYQIQEVPGTTELSITRKKLRVK